MMVIYWESYEFTVLNRSGVFPIIFVGCCRSGRRRRISSSRRSYESMVLQIGRLSAGSSKAVDRAIRSLRDGTASSSSTRSTSPRPPRSCLPVSLQVRAAGRGKLPDLSASPSAKRPDTTSWQTPLSVPNSAGCRISLRGRWALVPKGQSLMRFKPSLLPCRNNLPRSSCCC
jgi:hypothetical protein